MKYTVGEKFTWFRDNNWEAPEVVEVTQIRPRGFAKLSNGWVVDDEGVAEGTARVQGGRVLKDEAE